MSYKHFTEEDALAIASDAAAAKINSGDDGVFVSGENWGDQAISTFAEWCSAIPVDEEDAKYTGFYDWFLDQRGTEGEIETWEEYRDVLLQELTEIEIVEPEEIGPEEIPYEKLGNGMIRIEYAGYSFTFNPLDGEIVTSDENSGVTFDPRNMEIDENRQVFVFYK